MDLNELKSEWQNAGGQDKSTEALQKMTLLKNHPSFRKIRFKMVMETLSVLLLLIVYYDWFDGDQKPLYANMLLAGSAVLYVVNGLVGYRSLILPVDEPNIKISIENCLIRIRRLSVFSMVTAFLFAICMILFFSSTIHFTPGKSNMLLLLLAFLLVMTFFSYQFWASRIEKLEGSLKELND